MFRKFFSTMILALIFSGIFCQDIDKAPVALRDGDLIFQDLRCGILCEAINDVTVSYSKIPLSHAGIIYKNADNWLVIEAIGKDVHETALPVFLARSTDSSGEARVILGRVKKEFANLLPKALSFCKAQEGKLYDEEFEMNNDKYYCTELLYEAFRFANGEKEFFKLKPMTFKNKKDGQINPTWENYFRELGKEIPEGQAGCNPNEMIADQHLQILKGLKLKSGQF